MLRLLDIEYHKFKHSKSSKVIAVIYLVLIGLMMLIGLYRVPVNGQMMSLADMGIFNFPYVWHLNTFLLSFFKFLIAIVIVSITASEYSNRTLKQNLIDGLSKKELIVSKFLLVVVITVVLTFFVALVSFILGMIYSDYTEFRLIIRDLEFLGAFFISHLTFFSMCLFAGILVKRGAFALGLLSIWGFFELILQAFARYIGNVVNYDVWNTIDDFLPLTSTWYLISEPFSKMSIIKKGIETLSQEGFEKDYGVPAINIVVCLLWTLLFIYWSYALLKRRDL